MKKLLAAILAIMMLLTCCAAVAEEEIELTLHFWFDGTDLEDWQAIVDEFEEANPGVTVTLQSTPWSDYWTKLQTQMTSNSIADVYGMVSMYSADYIKNGAAYNLSDLAAADEDFIGFDSYYNAIMSAYQDDEGAYYYLPYDMSTMLLVVNKTLMAEYGIEYKEEGYTKEEILEMGEKLEGTGIYVMSSMSKTDWAYYDILTRAGCEILDENGLLKLNTPEIAEVTQFYVDLMNDGLHPVGGDSTDYFTSGLALMASSNPEGVANFVKSMPDADLDVISTYPTDVEGAKVIAEGGSFGIAPNCAHPELAFKLIQHLTGPSSSIRKVAGTFRGVPTVNDEAATESFLNSENGVAHAQFFLDLLEDSARPDYPNRTAVESEMAAWLSLAYAGDMNAAEALDEFQTIADDLMAE